MQIINSIVRFFQAIFSIIVLVISILLARQQYYGKVPSQTNYAAFTGALGIIAAAIGFASMFIDRLKGIISWVLDGVTAISLLAAGIAYAVALRGTSCDDDKVGGSTWDNPLISGGCYYDDDGAKWCRDGGVVKKRCTRATADAAFMFLACIACIGALVSSYITRNR
ncbi:hypothetical protein N7509_007177 [Penicillium cosmopolitanum]|uniref:MARVEL domain-containing protein n=1 Tax=Penicillium cosmopolitanum TaxID=1131564 RepID=A0A9X0B847_9EURO|nr:uncharacterized protein N7509_007177 [Penicillium cosmopolitanum]KAJ5391687.1 hypothetical protein N7509_007177 [Penicillium cosmopolitanum]